MSSEHRTNTIHLDVPLEVTVRIGGAVHPETADPRATERLGAFEAGHKRQYIDPDYRNRRGYDPGFIGGFRIPLPKLSALGMRRVAHRTGSEAKDSHVLKYHRYSLVMNRLRRLCYFTAANTTRDPEFAGTKKREELSKSDAWIFDPRIPEEYQIGHMEFYAPAVFDRGHIHRREDGYWGDTDEEAEAANFDTFHYTNSTPQHPRFNQSKSGGEWGLLENHIARQVGSQRYSIFAGPIFDRDDPEIERVLVPRRYWKIVLAPIGGDRLGAWAFVLDQSHLPFESRGDESFDPGRFVNRQRTIRYIQKVTDVCFDDVVHEADVAADEDILWNADLESLAGIRGLR